MAAANEDQGEGRTSELRSSSVAYPGTLQTPTVPETQGLRRVVDHIPNRLWVVALIGFFERACFWGISAPWQNYMQNTRDTDAAPGALGLGQSTATRIYCAFYIFYYVTPIGVALIADTHLGRFKSLCISGLLYVIGCGALWTTAGSQAAEGVALRGFVAALAFIGLGGGGFRALVVPFIADQYTDTRPKLKTLKSGEKVVTDRALTIQYIYNLFFWIGNVGSLSWFATTFLEKRYGFFEAYALPTLCMVIAMALLVSGSRWYIKTPSEGNVLPEASKILWCAAKDGFKIRRADPEYQLEHHARNVPWSSHLVKELGHGVKACRVLIAFVIFFVCFDQMQNNLISQAAAMETHGVPNDLLPGMNQVACIVLGPFVQSVLYPFLWHRHIDFKPITRITVGFGFISLAMLYATVVQQMIYTAGPCYSLPGKCSEEISLPNQVNVWIQTPVYVFIAIGELFAYVTALEYAYDHAPRDMKTIVQAISLLIAGLGSGCAMGLTAIVHDPHLVIMYACLASAMAVTAAVFWWRFRKYNKHDAPYPEEHIVIIEEMSPENDSTLLRPGASVLRLMPKTKSQLGLVSLQSSADTFATSTTSKTSKNETTRSNDNRAAHQQGGLSLAPVTPEIPTLNGAQISQKSSTSEDNSIHDQGIVTSEVAISDQNAATQLTLISEESITSAENPTMVLSSRPDLPDTTRYSSSYYSVDDNEVQKDTTK